ncbi:YbaY family lipoprotein [Pseudomonas sp. LS1212]|uniref:YbaY family lipoprotein n=1 Tax=Pseudomonas sp. LS1212 TaxID=2972478 RepID=UPI00215BA195|nr:YbaY family lipoprotein [Pseudomonas sp. LS1212]UVJ43513.1 YbaY family lipoprotein [Pseudomonas sp. LS1212]
MSFRALLLLGFASLLVACSSSAPKPDTSKPVVQTAPRATPDQGPLPAHQREVSGSLLGVPAGAEVELALLVIDERSRPQRLLASSKLNGTNQPLPFQLRFNPESFPAGARVELRGRASQAGQLILHLPSRRITQATTQALGPLRFERAP